MAGRGRVGGMGGETALRIEQFQFRIERAVPGWETKTHSGRRVVKQPKQTSSHDMAAMPGVGLGAIVGRMSGWTPGVMTMDCAFQLSTLALSAELLAATCGGFTSLLSTR